MLALLLGCIDSWTWEPLMNAVGVPGDSGTSDSLSPVDTGDSAGPLADDADHDAFSVAEGDCDDRDAAINPDAVEVCRDGVDNDCDGGANECELGDMNLSEADATFTGDAAGASVGQVLSNAGDVNGDGYDDMLIGATNFDDGQGGAVLFLGSAAPVSSSIRSAPVTLSAGGDGTGFGAELCGLGDFDGDGYGDVLVSAYSDGDGAGAVYLFRGGAVPLSRGAASADAAFVGQSTDDRAGASVAAVGDVNGDGLNDALIGSYRGGDLNSGTAIGSAYLVLGSRELWSGSLSGANSRFDGVSLGDYAGGSGVSGAGDVDADGFDDLLVGAARNSGSAPGSVYLLLGAESLTSTSLAAAEAEFTGGSSDGTGQAFAAAGDVNADGYGDMLVGAYSSGASYSGTAYLLLGSTAPLSGDLADAEIKFYGASANDLAGYPVAGAGDANADGFADVLIGAYGADGFGVDSGSAFLVLGASTLATMVLTDASATFAGAAPGDMAGIGASGAGDVNADGFGDILVGARANDDAGADAGAAYLILGTGL